MTASEPTPGAAGAAKSGGLDTIEAMMAAGPNAPIEDPYALYARARCDTPVLACEGMGRPAYLLTLVVLAANVIAPLIRNRQLRARLLRTSKLEERQQ